MPWLDVSLQCSSGTLVVIKQLTCDGWFGWLAQLVSVHSGSHVHYSTPAASQEHTTGNNTGLCSLCLCSRSCCVKKQESQSGQKKDGLCISINRVGWEGATLPPQRFTADIARAGRRATFFRIYCKNITTIHHDDGCFPWAVENRRWEIMQILSTLIVLIRICLCFGF